MSIVHLEPPADFHPKFQIAVCFIEHGGKILFLHRQACNADEHKDFKWATLKEALKLDLILGGAEGLHFFMANNIIGKQ